MRRRALLGALGATTVLFATGCSLPVIPKRPQPTARDALGWVRHAQGRYSLWLPRAEMGQHIGTALRLVAARELEVPPEAVALLLPSTQDIGRVRGTVGSESVRDFAPLVARACAALREAVAAGRTGEIALEEGGAGFVPRYLQPDAAPPAAGVVMAQGEALVRGQPLYAADVRRPGQRFGRVLRAPVSPELPSRLLRCDEAAAARVPGFVRLVRSELLTHGLAQGIGIVADTPGALDRIAAALAPRWDMPAPPEAPGTAATPLLPELDTLLARGALRHRLRSDPITTDGPWDVDLRLEVPLAAHQGIEPRAAVAEFADDGALSVWTGTQDAFYVRDVLARRLGLDAARIAVHGQRLGGGFGARTLCTVELEAAVLARAAGAPVKVQWSRAQELQLGFHRPPVHHRIRARLQGGRMQQWWHAFASSHILFTNAALPPWLQRLTDVVGDDGVARGALHPYQVGASRIEYDTVRLPVYTGPWRGLGAGPNNTAIECAIDECARAAGQDPLAFRLAHLPPEGRLAGVLREAARIAGWGGALPPGHGRGLACGTYKGMSHAAVVAEVAVQPGGRPHVTGLWCAHDGGRVIHPDGVRAQCEGNLVWGIGMVLSDALPATARGVQATGFGDAPIPRLDDVPPMQVALVDRGDPPGGAGETAIVACAAAILNAIRAATGVRVQRLPVARLDLPR